MIDAPNKPAAPEAAMLRQLVHKWRGFRWAVHSEVAYEGGRIDVVADTGEFSGDQLIAAHGKMALTDGLLEQARLTQGISDLTVLVVPRPMVRGSTFLARRNLAESMGLGLIYVDGANVIEIIKPKPNAAAQTDILRAALHQGQQTIGAAGSKGDYHTAEREWVERIRAALEQFGELRLIEAYDLQPRGRDRIGKNAVPRAIHRMLEAGKLEFATIRTTGGRSVLVHI